MKYYVNRREVSKEFYDEALEKEMQILKKRCRDFNDCIYKAHSGLILNGIEFIEEEEMMQEVDEREALKAFMMQDDDFIFTYDSVEGLEKNFETMIDETLDTIYDSDFNRYLDVRYLDVAWIIINDKIINLDDIYEIFYSNLMEDQK